MGLTTITNHNRQYYCVQLMVNGNKSRKQFPHTPEGFQQAESWMNEKKDLLARIPPINAGKQKMDRSGLDERFTKFYKSRERVRVLYLNGETEFFYVARTEGKAPVYVKLLTNKSTQGEAIDPSDLIISITGTGVFKK